MKIIERNKQIINVNGYLTDKYLWYLTQEFAKYSDIIKSKIKVIENTNIGSFSRVFVFQDRIYVQFLGTQFSLKDLLVDMFFFKKKLYNKVKVHAGFWSAVESIFYKLSKYLFIDLDGINKEIIVFGHSMGGAMAKEFTRSIKDYILNIKVITFGTPRTGNKYYAEEFDKIDMVEYRMRSDLICMLPPKWLNYSHTKHIKKVGKFFNWNAHHKYGGYL